LKSVDTALRWHTKYTRQNGIHVSPTFMINGLIEPAMSSGQDVEEWAKLLSPHVGSSVSHDEKFSTFRQRCLKEGCALNASEVSAPSRSVDTSTCST
jgi:hypothetical protein